ncbi:hypothetical protein [Streptomyces sp. NPDC056690]|uniref:hypothetical protein n=1 Tax=unclassified Streptomyces TaxID=2593676 RepID=UPI0036316F96
MANFSYGSAYNVNIQAQERVNFTMGWDVHRLALTFEVTAHGNYTEDAPFLVSGRLWAFDVPGPANWIGVLAPAGPVALKPFATTLTMETTVTGDLLRGLEKARAGADCALVVGQCSPRGEDCDPGRSVRARRLPRPRRPRPRTRDLQHPERLQPSREQEGIGTRPGGALGHAHSERFRAL